MSGSSPNLVVEAELTRQRRIAEWQAAVQGPAMTVQQAIAQALGALAVLSERSRCVLGQSLMGTFVDPVAEPVVVAASKPVNPALARAMGCGSRQAIGFMVR